MKNYGVIIIGGGQAGIALGQQLEKNFSDYIILDSNEQVGDAWRKRYDALTLFTSRQYCSLPEKVMPGDPEGYPSKDEMADYLEQYAAHFDIVIKKNSTVTSLKKIGDNYYVNLENGERLSSRSVVLATGGFQLANTKNVRFENRDMVAEFSVNSYKNASNLPGETVLVVGDGASGRQIALDICKHKSVILATGKKRKLIPQRLFGHDIFWWLDKIGILSARSNSLIAKMVRKRDPFPGENLSLKQLSEHGIKINSRLKTVINGLATFVEGDSEKINTIIWTAGFRNDTRWLDIKNVVDSRGQYIHTKGVSPIKGLFYIGQPWQTCRGSALITGLERDCRLIADQISQHLADDFNASDNMEAVL